MSADLRFDVRLIRSSDRGINWTARRVGMPAINGGKYS